MIGTLKSVLVEGSAGRWILSGYYHHPVRFTCALLRSLICTRRLCGSFWPIRVRIAPGQDFKVSCAANRSVEIRGVLSVSSWGGSSLPSSLSVGADSRVAILGDFEIGPGVHISVGAGGTLRIGGNLKSAGSGITCNSRIMVEHSVAIGHDCIIAWDVFISDSDWHNITGIRRHAPVVIGDHVWISHGVSVLKGAEIPAGCIVGAKSLVSSKIDAGNALIAGIPAEVRSTGVEWSR